MSRPALPGDLRPGDILAFRKAWVDEHPEVPWYLIGEGIALAERLVCQDDPLYIHIAIVRDVNDVGVAGVGRILAVEEEPAGCEVRDEPLDDRWSGFRPNWRARGDGSEFVAKCEEALGTRYAFKGLLRIAEARLLHRPLTDDPSSEFVCSTLAAEKGAEMGYAWFPHLKPDEIAPCDFPGFGMRMIVDAGRWVGDRPASKA